MKGRRIEREVAFTSRLFGLFGQFTEGCGKSRVSRLGGGAPIGYDGAVFLYSFPPYATRYSPHNSEVSKSSGREVMNSTVASVVPRAASPQRPVLFLRTGSLSPTSDPPSHPPPVCLSLGGLR
ncbi:hypothetical protein EYF80_050175 [Liparis tanakae]|uniref:Uncharacterized protein n=1 Tax=Liparis tanakae TaxID=230148 RepID=A0A4Z2FFX4_9TELE|nr:hypothetical protein EYF80_050175 [Liparis tanakae]